MFSYVVSPQKWRAHFLLQQTKEKFTESNAYQAGKATKSFKLLIRLKFQGYRCKSDMSLFLF